MQAMKSFHNCWRLTICTATFARILPPGVLLPSLPLPPYFPFPFFPPQPMEIYIDDDTKLKLTSLRQHYVKLEDAGKNRKLFGLLDELEFNQVIFCARVALLSK